MTLADFEALVLAQQPTTVPWEPVTDYSFETRRAIEGDHPRLILETFAPAQILDVGSGPGHLVQLLNAHAGRPIALGADKDHPAAFYRFDIADPLGALRLKCDLVICREVLEHLTVLQIRRAVTHLCALSTRYVYVTTRFHPNPASLLDVATSDGLDPTHISMLAQDFVRALFVLEGFRRRADLEQALDWQHKGRCLVYERV